MCKSNLLLILSETKFASEEHVFVDGKQQAEESFLHVDIEMLQMQKHYRVHLRNDTTDDREPFAACCRKDNPKLSRNNYPRFLWLINRAGSSAQTLIRAMIMASADSEIWWSVCMDV